MSGEKTALPLIRTKFNRPSLTSDFLPRTKLLEILNENLQRKLTLVSAPAGYGKTTLVSSWLESPGIQSTWLSLNKNDNDLRNFLEYFITSVRQIYPEACPRTMDLLQAPSTPSLQILSAELVNELDAIQDPYILVLDDYGFIHLPQIHEMLHIVLQHAPDTLHLVILTRRDPPLPLVSLRASGEIMEVRQADLKFTEPEAAHFIRNTIEASFDEASLSRLYELTEGWPTGLRLTALSLRHRDDVKDFVREMSGDIRHVQDYLISEVLAHQIPEIRNGLLKTSILNRFNKSLVETVCGPEIEGQAFLDHLENSNLFCVHLDEKHEWYRYHHLFQELLLRNLEQRYSKDEIKELHRTAGIWFAENGHFEDGLHHTLESDDPPSAASRIVAQNRGLIMSVEGYHRLRTMIGMLPPDLVENEPELLLAQAWSMIGFIELYPVLDRVQFLLGQRPNETTGTDRLKGEYKTLRGLQYLNRGQGQDAVTIVQQALQLLPPESISERSFALIILAISHQMMGNLDEARSIALKGLEEKGHHSTTYQARMLAALCFVLWLEGDLNSFMNSAKQYLKLGEKIALPESIAHGHYFLGIGHYERNELEEAEKHLAAVVHDTLIVNTHNFVHSAFALALVYQAQGRPDNAEEIIDLVRSWALEVQFPSLIDMSRGLQAEFLLKQGRISEAGQWTRIFRPHPIHGGYRFYIPFLTLPKVHIALDTEESRKEAEDLLSSSHAFFSSTHNTGCLLKVMAMQAMLRSRQGDEPAALSTLEEAVALGESGGFIRPFLDLGPDMAGLLNRLTARDGVTDYVSKLLADFGEATSTQSLPAPSPAVGGIEGSHSPSPESLLGSLSNREAQILEMLSQRLSNKEIAQQLFISPATVKRHTINIYQKLDVNSRRHAVDKALSLGILAGN